jgi:hypothetical protein
MTMNDLRATPPRVSYQPVRSDNSVNWIIGAVALFAFVGAAWWGMGRYQNTTIPAPHTTGQTTPTTPIPVPAPPRTP